MSETTKSVIVVVLGGGLAGLASAIEAHKAGARVTIVEKEPRLGGNSAKATSGINGADTRAQKLLNITDNPDLLTQDTLHSGGSLSQDALVRVLSTRSADAVAWLESQFGLDLSVVSRCGGHSRPRTHRCPANADGTPAPVGWGIVSAMTAHVKGCGAGMSVVTGAEVRAIRVGEVGRVVGVTIAVAGEEGLREVEADAVVLATGGFAGKTGREVERGGRPTVLSEVAPELVGLATTNGPWASGDGILLGRSLGAAMVDLDKVQIHPTGFVHPTTPSDPTKFLAPEALRAHGGLLLNARGYRFVNELGLRDAVSTSIFENCGGAEKAQHPDTVGDDDGLRAAAFLVMNDEAVRQYDPATIGFYTKRGLFIRIEGGIDGLAKTMGAEVGIVRETFSEYDEAAGTGRDRFGKTVFPVRIGDGEGVFWLAVVTPSLHYTMGGTRINTDAQVLKELSGGQYVPIPGLYAAGEVTGGVHGRNRLAGNSLLECVVFGRIAGRNAAQARAE